MGKDILIIGGGITGLCSAYYLQKEGHKVTVLDKGDITAGASFVNAGFITPSHIIPLASPGMITQGIRMMFNSSSPFYMKPRLDYDFLKWSWYFYKSSTHKKVEKAIPVLKDINIFSQDLYTDIRTSGDLGAFQLEKKGLLMLYKTEASYLHEKEVAEKARDLGLEVSELNNHDLSVIEPDVKIAAEGAIHYECDGHTTPTEFMPKMLDYLKKVGVCIITNEEVVDVIAKGNTVTEVITLKNKYQPDALVLAAGSWSAALSKKLKINIPLQAGKGYSINAYRNTGISIPAILMEAKIAVTPMSGFTRFAGTMEFSGINNVIKTERVNAISNGVTSFYPEVKITTDEIKNVKTGLRPVSPDGLPYIGKSQKYDNLIFATGHAMMGWSLGPATGKLVAELLGGGKTSLGISACNPNRKFK